MAIDSVLQQSHQDFELIIVDDGSKDDSFRIAKSYSEGDGRILVLENERNMGAAYSRNAAIQRAKGRFLAFLDADDYWRPEKLRTQLRVFESDPGISVVCSSYQRVTESQKPLKIRLIDKQRLISLPDLLGFNPVGCLTVMIDRSRVKSEIKFPPYKRRQDWALWLDIVSRGEKFVGIPDVLACYRVSTQSLSSNKTSAAAWCWFVYRQHMRLDRLKSSYYFLIYAFGNLRFRLIERLRV